MAGLVDTIESSRALGHKLTEAWCIKKGGDVGPFFDLFHDDAICETMADKELFPELGGKMTKQQFRDYVYAESRNAELKVRVVGITAEPQRVAVEADSDMSLNEHVYQNVYHWLFEVRNQKVTHARFYLDTLLARRFVDWLKEDGAKMDIKRG